MTPMRLLLTNIPAHHTRAHLLSHQPDYTACGRLISQSATEAPSTLRLCLECRRRGLTR